MANNNNSNRLSMCLKVSLSMLAIVFGVLPKLVGTAGFTMKAADLFAVSFKDSEGKTLLPEIAQLVIALAAFAFNFVMLAVTRVVSMLKEYSRVEIPESLNKQSIASDVGSLTPSHSDSDVSTGDQIINLPAESLPLQKSASAQRSKLACKQCGWVSSNLLRPFWGAFASLVSLWKDKELKWYFKLIGTLSYVGGSVSSLAAYVGAGAALSFFANLIFGFSGQLPAAILLPVSVYIAFGNFVSYAAFKFGRLKEGLKNTQQHGKAVAQRFFGFFLCQKQKNVNDQYVFNFSFVSTVCSLLSSVGYFDLAMDHFGQLVGLKASSVLLFGLRLGAIVLGALSTLFTQPVANAAKDVKNNRGLPPAHSKRCSTALLCSGLKRLPEHTNAARVGAGFLNAGDTAFNLVLGMQGMINLMKTLFTAAAYFSNPAYYCILIASVLISAGASTNYFRMNFEASVNVFSRRSRCVGHSKAASFEADNSDDREEAEPLLAGRAQAPALVAEAAAARPPL